MKLSILGCGVMGSALLTAALNQKVVTKKDVTVAEPDAARRAAIAKQFGVKVTADNHAAIGNADAILLAVKPQHAADALADVRTNALVISILAGTTIPTLTKLTGSKKIVRVMPNTPAQIGAGIAGWFATTSVTASEKEFVKNLLAATGAEVELKKEKLIDAVTAISGSGPAYFFAFVEALATAGKTIGLDATTAGKLAAHTFFGAAKLAETSGVDFKTLRERVTSKGGTTAAALASFEKDGLVKTVERATQAAKTRSEELSKLK